jgi:NADH-quinone oxidoreductase subunit H
VTGLSQWYDLRDLGNPIHHLLDWINGWGDGTTFHWVSYVVSGLVGAAAIGLFLGVIMLFLIWLERRAVARIQIRRGPNRLGPYGLLQPLADALKLMQKDAITPRLSDRVVYTLAPLVIFIPTLLVFAVLPFGDKMQVSNINVALLFIVAVGSTTPLMVFMAGYSSNNKYSLVGSMRAVAMAISYEIPMVLALLAMVLWTGSMALNDIVHWQQQHHIWLIFLQPLAALIYFISASAELNRTPTDIAEAESEIVAGYHTEYSGMKFGLFYAVEMANALAVSALIATLFFGGWWLYGLDRWIPGYLIFFVKTLLLYSLLILTRGTLPRLRIDQLLDFAWKFLLPLALVNVVVVAAEVLLWQQNGLAQEIFFPACVVINGALTVILIVGYVRAFGLHKSMASRKVRLARDPMALMPQ